MICNTCHAEIADNSNVCPHCGAPVYAAPQQPAYPVAVPQTTKPRSAYVAAILHLLLGIIGFGYSYRGMSDKAKNCVIMFIVGVCTMPLCGAGSILLLVLVIINLVEAIKLFNGKYPADAYGRPLYQEF